MKWVELFILAALSVIAFCLVAGCDDAAPLATVAPAVTADRDAEAALALAAKPAGAEPKPVAHVPCEVTPPQTDPVAHKPVCQACGDVGAIWLKGDDGKPVRVECPECRKHEQAQPVAATDAANRQSTSTVSAPPAKSCPCSPACTCGCQQGQSCTCGQDGAQPEIHAQPVPAPYPPAPPVQNWTLPMTPYRAYPFTPYSMQSFAGMGRCGPGG